MFEIHPDDGEMVLVGAGSRDVAVWERSGKGRTLTAWQTNAKTEDTYRVCWIALERAERRGTAKVPDGVTDWVTLMDLCDVVSITPEEAAERHGFGQEDEGDGLGPTQTDR